MIPKASADSSNRQSSFLRRNVQPIVFIVACSAFLWIYSLTAPVTVDLLPTSMELREGKTSSSGLAFYQCGVRGADMKQLVLLHGSKFTKEDWKTSGILEDFCQDPFYSVTALDLSVKSTYKDLQDVLQGLQNDKLITLPITAIVTPSASGLTITSWIESGEEESMEKYFHAWVSVANYALFDVAVEKLKRLTSLNLFILAIHGRTDHKGHEASALLRQHADGYFVELPGGHPCYLDSPRQFVDTLREQLKKTLLL